MRRGAQNSSVGDALGRYNVVGAGAVGGAVGGAGVGAGVGASPPALRASAASATIAALIACYRCAAASSLRPSTPHLCCRRSLGARFLV
jgi:hypothetical protein